MLVTNSFSDEILVFVYDVDYVLYFVALRDPSTHFLTLANAEVLIPAGQSHRLVHNSRTHWLVGVKCGSLTGRFEPFLAPLSRQIYDATAELDVTAAGQLIWLNPPKIDNPTQRLPAAELMRPSLPPAPGHVIGVGRANITDAAVRVAGSALPMQGWTLIDQTTEGIELDGQDPIWLQARAFLIGDPASATRMVFVPADIWSCSIAIKQDGRAPPVLLQSRKPLSDGRHVDRGHPYPQRARRVSASLPL